MNRTNAITLLLISTLQIALAAPALWWAGEALLEASRMSAVERRSRNLSFSRLPASRDAVPYAQAVTVQPLPSLHSSFNEAHSPAGVRQ